MAHFVLRYELNLNDAVNVASRKGLVLGLGNSIIWFLLFIMFAGVMWFGTYLIQEDNLEAGKILPVCSITVITYSFFSSL